MLAEDTREVPERVAASAWTHPRSGIAVLSFARMFDDDLALARELAIAAADVAMAHFRRGVSARRKSDGSALTDADLAVEAALLETLASRRPADAVLSEEHGAIGASSRRWILDPIDGTSSFAAGRAISGVRRSRSRSMRRSSWASSPGPRAADLVGDERRRCAPRLAAFEHAGCDLAGQQRSPAAPQHGRLLGGER